MGTVYIIRNTENSKVYIGQTTSSLKERFGHHLSSLACEDKQDMKLYKAMNEIGKDRFFIGPLLENVPDDLLIEKEAEYIDKYESHRNGYNARAGGKGGKSLSLSEERQILEMAKNGVGGTEIAKLYGVHVATIYRSLIRNGFKYNHLNDGDVLEMFNHGMTIKEISLALGVDKKTIHRHMRKMGIRTRKTYVPHRDSFDFDGLKKDYYNQMKIPDICKKYNISVTTFYRIKNDKDLKTRPRIYSTGKVRVMD